MPELNEEMYCHQQICIPPTFPYLLRQYAKAAIRSQPTDLLKWSTAYFRCLSLNIPPPVKPRLEYPIPRDYVGITPGWLRALNYQLLNSKTVPFKILWDRWIGSCLEHETLIKILCLGGFTDSLAIPWNNFLGLCAAHLTENLTQTMILFCEILTEEPEGGSAMIPLEVFLDVYKFLAAIDASQPQILINYYFTDAALNLYEKKKKKAAKVRSAEEVATVESSTPTAEEAVEEQEYEVLELGEESIVSCPDIVSDDVLLEPELEEDKKIEEEEEEEMIALKQHDDMMSDVDDDRGSLFGKDDSRLFLEGDSKGLDGKDDSRLAQHEGSDAQKSSSTIIQEDSKIDVEFEAASKEGAEESSINKKSVEDVDSKDSLDKEEESGDHLEDETKREEEHKKRKTPEDQLRSVEKDILEKGGIELEDEIQEVYDDMDDGKASVYSERPTTKEEPEEIHGEGGFYKEIDELEEHIRVKYKNVGVMDDLEQEEIEEEEMEAPEEVEVDAIPGIGPIVPEELVEAVVVHLTKVASEEHGMTMPRHIRHYTCPPLEIYQ